MARTLGLEVAVLEVRRAEDIAPIFAALKSQAKALYVVGDPLMNANRHRINIGLTVPPTVLARADGGCAMSLSLLRGPVQSPPRE